MRFLDILFGPGVPKIDVQAAYEQLQATPKPVIVDVREPSETAQGIVKGAVLIPLGQIGNRLDKLPEEKPILMICRSGNRSKRAASQLMKAGYDVTNVTGGMNAWQRAGLPVRKPGKHKR